jgi:photosystem II stability/assembly factor-like uncharacterized protein
LDGLVAASSYGGVYLSTDQGGHWARLKAPQASGTTVNLAVEGNCVWLGTDAGVYRSLDRGVTWSLGRPTDRDTLIQAIVSDPPFLLALAHEGVYRSSDSGSSWTRLALGRSGDNWDLGHLAHAGSRLFMTLQYRGLLVSPDHGDTWSEDGSLTGFKGIFLGMGADVYATRDGVYRSSDQGATWTGVHTGMAATSVNRLASAGPGKVAATAVGDAFGTEDGGDHWRLLSPPRGNGKIGAIANLGDICMRSIRITASSGPGTWVESGNPLRWSMRIFSGPKASFSVWVRISAFVPAQAPAPFPVRMIPDGRGT